MTRNWKVMIVLVTVALLLLPACATKKYVQNEIANQSDKIQSVESQVEENQARIKDVDGKVAQVDRKADQAQATGDQALDKGNQAFKSAEEAMRLAQGKLVLEESISNNVTRFAVNKWDLPDGAIGALDNLVSRAMGMNKRVYFEIQGHTDSSGTEKWNMELGYRRAEAVRHYLNEKGVPLYAMSIISYGESKPIADNSSRDGRAENRRVVVRVLE
jgi:outer membrane protein OmpA-like peptidoglycan-associated protein